MIDYLEGITVLIDKPYKWTSFDVVNKMRWHLKQKLGIKKIKVGHAGTLDPLATGLLIICIGKDTKKIDSFMGGMKTYTGTFLLGKTTPCYDLEQDFDAEYPTEHITSEEIQKVVEGFIGVQEQMPPIFSAKQVDGKRAYDLARAGKAVELKTNTIEIHSFTVDTSRFPEIDFEISCSKGTYIRSIANDFGEKLNSGATLIALRRTKSGDFDIKNAFEVEKWIAELKNS
jgi:tRNA pseudouridine55 synthase|tara:strand:- start:21648 stop:22334 length:687 start_codon:yes stop_codon:yes gene_type:complete